MNFIKKRPFLSAVGIVGLLTVLGNKFAPLLMFGDNNHKGIVTTISRAQGFQSENYAAPFIIFGEVTLAVFLLFKLIGKRK